MVYLLEKVTPYLVEGDFTTYCSEGVNEHFARTVFTPWDQVKSNLGIR